MLVVCKDPGGVNAVLPVYDALVRGGGSAVLIASGKAVELLQNGSCSFRWYPSAEAALVDIPNPAALVASMCSSGSSSEIGRALVPLLRGRCPTIAVQDFWGAGLRTTWKDAALHPDSIVVNDHVDAAIVQRAWPDYKLDRIAVLGYPALDRYACMDVGAISSRVRAELGIASEEPVITFAGQLHHSGAMLADVARAIAGVGQPVCLIPRAHPRMRNDAPHEVSRWEAAIAQFQSGRCITDTTRWSTSEIVAASTVVISMYSTVLIEAASVRRPTIAVLYPDVGMAELLESTGGIMPEFPLVELGCCAKAVDPESLRIAVGDAVSGRLAKRLRPAQERVFQLDGKNAERVAEFVRERIAEYR